MPATLLFAKTVYDSVSISTYDGEECHSFYTRTFTLSSESEGPVKRGTWEWQSRVSAPNDEFRAYGRVIGGTFNSGDVGGVILLTVTPNADSEDLFKGHPHLKGKKFEVDLKKFVEEGKFMPEWPDYLADKYVTLQDFPAKSRMM